MTPEFVDVINGGHRVHPVSSRDQQTDREGPTDDGRHLGEAPSAVSQLAQPSAQHRPHRWCEHCLTSVRGDPARSASMTKSGLPSVSLRAVPPIPDQSCLHRVAEQRASQWWFRRVGRVTRWSLPGRGPASTSQRGDDAVGSPPTGQYRHEDRCRMSGTDNETDQLVVSASHHCRSSMIQQRGRSPATMARQHRTTMALAASDRFGPLAGKRRGVRAGDERLGPPDRVERVDVASDSIRSEQVDDGTPRQSTRSLVCTSRCHHVSVCSNTTAEFQCETGLSDPRFPGHQEEMCSTLPRGVPCLDELVPFKVATDERRFGDG